MKIDVATKILTTTFAFALFSTAMAPIALADGLTGGSNDFVPIVPDVTNCSVPDTAPYASADAVTPAVSAATGANEVIPGVVPFDLSASRSFNLPSPAAQPNNDLLPSQSVESASTPNVSGQMPTIQTAPQTAVTDPTQQLPQVSPTETQTAQEWRKAAFESLTNNPNVQPMFGRAQSQNQNASANANASATGGANGNINNGAPGNNFTASQMAMNAPNGPAITGMNNQPAQSQTLTGPSSNQQYGQATKRGNGSPGGGSASSGMMGITRFASMFTMMGGGLMMSSMMRR